MQSESNPAFRKRLLKALAALGIFAFLLWWVLYNSFFDKRLFHIDPEQVFHLKPRNISSIEIRNRITFRYRIVTDSEEIRSIANYLNDFTYESSEELRPTTGWTYRMAIDFKSGEERLNINFGDAHDGTGYIRVFNEDFTSTIYYCSISQIQELLDLAKNC